MKRGDIMAILVVDDASVMRMVIKDTLVRYCNYSKDDIFEADGGKTAMAQYRQVKPELVLCDIAMLDINGVDLVKQIIAIDPEAKIIMCTASSDRSSVRECIRAGALDYIVKPPTPERIRQAVRKIIGEPEEGEGGGEGVGEEEAGEEDGEEKPDIEPDDETKNGNKKFHDNEKIEDLTDDVDALKNEIVRLRSLLDKS